MRSVKSRFHKKIHMLKRLTVLAVLLLSGAAMAGETACFASGEAYMTAKYGADFRDDENLLLKKERYGKQVYYAARDVTSGTNHPITLLMQKPGQGWCAVLATPPVASIRAVKLDKKGRPLAFFAKDQGTTLHELTYVWETASATFKPASCAEVTWVGKRSMSNKVACDSIAEQ